MPKSRPRLRSTEYPWRDETVCRLLADAPEYVPAMLAAIDSARSYILIEMYLVEASELATRLIDALSDAASRGVTVYAIFDGFGARGMARRDRRQLTAAGIAVHYYHPFAWTRLGRYLVRDHRKLLLVDGRIVYTGGVGLTDGMPLPDGSYEPWHDLAIESQGPVVADWQDLFIRRWRHATNQEIALPVIPRTIRGTASKVGAARVVYSHPGRINAIYAHLRRRIAGAKHRAWIATAYFLPSWRLRRALRQAASRGIDVRLLLPGPITDNRPVRYASQRFYTRLLKAGVRIYEYAPAFMHAKVALVDDWISIGSSNFDRWSLSRNLEANQEVYDKDFAVDVTGRLRVDLTRAVEINFASWQARPLLHRWREQLWGLIEAWTDHRDA